MKRDIYQEVTDTIISQLEAGAAPWRKPWEGGADFPLMLPVNGTTGKDYRGVNICLLWGSTEKNRFTTHEWATFKQWQEKGEAVKKGEKGSIIVFYSTLEKKNEESGAVEEIPFLKLSHVFNRCQLESYNAETAIKTDKPNLVEAIEGADRFVTGTGANINHNGGDRAFYRRATDEIYMPARTYYTGTDTQTPTEAYYSTLLHEITHWSGAPHRLNREKGKKFGDNAYAFEELIAEMGAAFLCAKLGIADAPRPDHANYLANWLQVLKNDKKAVIQAASAASKACDYLHGLVAGDIKPAQAAEVVEMPTVLEAPAAPIAALAKPVITTKRRAAVNTNQLSLFA